MIHFLGRIQINTICTAPWNQIFVANDGHFYTCCMSEGKELPLSHNGETLHISQVQSIEEVLNSSSLEKTRELMLQGSFPAFCSACLNEEKINLDSYRQYLNRKHYDLYLDIISKKSVLPKVEFLDVRAGNTCNLKCRMCHPGSSNAWKEDWQLLFSLENIERDISWGKIHANLDKIFLTAKKLKYIHFAGGEPFITPATLQLLQALDDNNILSEINLSFNTNLTFLPEKIIAFMKKSKSVRLMISLDGTKAVNNYIRFPSQFNEIEENLKKLEHIASEVHFLNCCVVYTLQTYNAFDICSFITYLKDLNNQIVKQNIKFNILSTPSCYSIRNIPLKFKKLLIQDLLNFLTSLNPSDGNLYHAIRPIISALEEEHHENPEDLREFKRRTLILDSSRSQSLAKSIPVVDQILRDII